LSNFNFAGVLFAASLIAGYTYDFFASLVSISSSVMISAFFFKYQFKQMNQQFVSVSFCSQTTVRVLFLTPIPWTQSANNAITDKIEIDAIH
jgi:hypothetical protein